ncbi:hypothetical protein [uncultured Cellulomonas sp.]|uniref:hypothetical protein n=1 Tax=uncultured Cellulomonas sp. TaxID=189682 RepID=UPI002634E216|nr:hypothetical protein [uncultured Cellulomonas sp.]
MDDVARPNGVPGGQAVPADAQDVVDARLAELGDYVLEPIDVEPFTVTLDGVTFGWRIGEYDDGTHDIDVEPGDVIADHDPFDGLWYDT